MIYIYESEWSWGVVKTKQKARFSISSLESVHVKTQSLDKVEVVSPCPFLKKVEVASGGGGTTISFKVVKVASSSHSLKKMAVAS